MTHPAYFDSVRDRYRTQSKFGTDLASRVGCGLGGFYIRLSESAIETHYPGVDIVPEMVQEAGALYGVERFHVGNLTSIAQTGRRLDYVFAGAIFCFDTAHGFAGMQESIRATFGTRARHCLQFAVIQALPATRTSPGKCRSDTGILLNAIA